MASSVKSDWAAPGFTLLELAIGMLLMAVLAIGISGLVKTGVEAQMSERVHQNMQTVVLNMVDDIRLDIRKADSVKIDNGGNRLTITSFNTRTNANETTLYALSQGKLTRQDASGGIKTYNDPQTDSNRLQVSCPQGCFVATALNSRSQPRQIRIPEIRVAETPLAGNPGTVIDRHFGTANFTLRDFAFDVASSMEFQ